MTRFLTFTTCRRSSFDLFIHTAVMMGTDTFSYFLSTIFISLHFSKLTIETKKRERKKNDRASVKNANQAKSVCVMWGLSLAFIERER
jgi:hypothetical protein